MPSLEAYKAALDYSYAPGVFPSMECLEHRPEQVRRLLVHLPPPNWSSTTHQPSLSANAV